MPRASVMTALRAIDRRIAFILIAGAIVGFASTIPLTIQLLPRFMGPSEQAELRELPLPIPVIFALGFLQNTVLLGAAVVFGLALAKQVGLGAPELEAWRAGTPRPGLARRLAIAAVIGLATGLVLIGLDVLVLLPRTGVGLAKSMADIPLWKRLLAGVIYGGLTEEVLTRLFVVSGLVCLFARVWRREDGRPSAGAVWAAIGIASFLFALGHLPLASRLGELTPWLVVRVLVLNGTAGMVYGWLYTRRGLEAAMVAHAATHVPLQILAGMAANAAG